MTATDISALHPTIHITLPTIDLDPSGVFYDIFMNPTMKSRALSKRYGLDKNELIGVYRIIQKSPQIRDLMTSHHYPRYLLVRYFESLIRDMLNDPEYFLRVVNDEPVAPRVLEIHVTGGKCFYECEMCLWRMGSKQPYHGEDQNSLTTDQWINVLYDAKSIGTNTVIFSGGGEPLMHKNLDKVMKEAKNLGMNTMLYTNGRLLFPLRGLPTYDAIKNHLDWLRVSMHAASGDTYSRIVGRNRKLKDFEHVVHGIETFIKDRGIQPYPSIGIGFVVQKKNFHEVRDMTDLALDLGVDFLDIRVDCVDATEELTKSEKQELRGNLLQIRADIDSGNYQGLDITFADFLVGMMNGWEAEIKQPRYCKVHLYRPSISPYGRVAVCDLMAEPYFSRPEYTIGWIEGEHGFSDLIKDTAGRRYDAEACTVCMPGQESINAIWEKVLDDFDFGIDISDQPFVFERD